MVVLSISHNLIVTETTEQKQQFTLQTIVVVSSKTMRNRKQAHDAL